MSTVATPAPNPVLLGIVTQFDKYASLVDPAITLVEQNLAAAPSATKAQAAVTIIQTLAHIGEANPNPNVALISVLVDMGVGIANDIGKFFHKKTAPVAPAVAQVAQSGALAGVATVQPATESAPVAHADHLTIGDRISSVFHPNQAAEALAAEKAKA